MTSSRTLLVSAVYVALLAAPLRGQGAPDPMSIGSSRTAVRAELTAAAEELERYVGSTAYSESLRSRARGQVAAIRRRLVEGDFQVGDRIHVRIEGQSALDDTVTVTAGRQIMIRGFRQVSVAGLLRTELEPLLRTDLADFVRQATVTARPLTRVAVFGAVNRPGYVSAPIEATLDQLLSLAGGPTTTADASEVKVMRSDTTLLTRRDVTAAVARGRTIGDLGLQDGDVLVVPLQGLPWDRNAILQIASFVVTPLLAIFVVQRR